jgi:hypothetical protein
VILADLIEKNGGSLLGPCQFPGCGAAATIIQPWPGLCDHKTCVDHSVDCDQPHPDECLICLPAQEAYIKASNRAVKSKKANSDWREFRDYDALREIVKRGFLALAMEKHPDHGGTQEAFEHLRMGQIVLNRMIDSREGVSRPSRPGE